MAFPDNTTSLDTFTLTAWLSDWTAFFGSGITNDASTVHATGSNGAADQSDASYRNTSTHGPSGHFYAEEVVNVAGSWQGIHFVVNPGSGTTDGYAWYVSYGGSDRIRNYRIDNDVLTQIGSQVSYTPASGNLVGIDRNATNGDNKAWADTGSGWTDLGGGWNDTTYTTGTSWRIALESSFNFDSGGNAWTNLWGGTVTPAGGATLPHRLLLLGCGI